MPKNKEITIEGLAGMMKREFDQTNKKITNFQRRNQKQHQNLATKDDVNTIVKKELGEAKEEIKKEIKEDVTGATSQLLTKADEVISKLDILEKEEKAGTALYKRHDKKIENHEKRIKKLEGEFAFD